MSSLTRRHGEMDTTKWRNHSWRFCLYCNETTEWIYDKTIKHSRCTKCDSDSLLACRSRKSSKNAHKCDYGDNTNIKTLFMYLKFAETNEWAWIHLKKYF